MVYNPLPGDPFDEKKANFEGECSKCGEHKPIVAAKENFPEGYARPGTEMCRSCAYQHLATVWGFFILFFVLIGWALAQSNGAA